MDTCHEKLELFSLDSDHFELLEAVKNFSAKMQNAKFTDAASALDQDGDGDVDEAEFEAAQMACNSCHLLMASTNFDECAMHLEAMTLGLLSDTGYTNLRHTQILDFVSKARGIATKHDCGKYAQDLLDAFTRDTKASTDPLQLPPRATAVKKLVKDLGYSSDSMTCTQTLDVCMLQWLEPIVFSSVSLGEYGWCSSPVTAD